MKQLGALVLLPDRNVIKNDWKGAFLPESINFASKAFPQRTKLVVTRQLIDVGKTEANMRAQVALAFIDAKAAGFLVPRVAFFCHGFKNRIQLGFRMPHVDQLANLISASCGETLGPIVTLYACSTGGGDGVNDEQDGGDGGFADALRDALCHRGRVNCRVDSHTIAGHTTQLAYVRRFEGMGSEHGGTGGSWLVAPGSKLWPAWKAALKDKSSTLRYRYGAMTVAEVHAELAKGL